MRFTGNAGRLREGHDVPWLFIEDAVSIRNVRKFVILRPDVGPELVEGISRDVEDLIAVSMAFLALTVAESWKSQTHCIHG